jgi:hypothetical protein
VPSPVSWFHLFFFHYGVFITFLTTIASDCHVNLCTAVTEQQAPCGYTNLLTTAAVTVIMPTKEGRQQGMLLATPTSPRYRSLLWNGLDVVVWCFYYFNFRSQNKRCKLGVYCIWLWVMICMLTPILVETLLLFWYCRLLWRVYECWYVCLHLFWFMTSILFWYCCLLRRKCCFVIVVYWCVLTLWMFIFHVFLYFVNRMLYYMEDGQLIIVEIENNCIN